VLQYLKKLAPGKQIFLLTYEKPVDWRDVGRRQRLVEEVCKAGIRWVPLSYHKRPTSLATAYDIQLGLAVSLFLVFRNRIGIIHARSYVPGLIALALKRLTGARLVFDMRGFWPDERAEGGMWSKGSILYRVAKRFERQVLLSADAVVSLTHAGVAAMQGFDYLQRRQPPFYVIPTCTNLELFCASGPRRSAGGVFTLGYVGGTGLWYDFDAAVACFKILFQLRPAARIVIINRDEHAYIRARLSHHNLNVASIQLRRLDFAEMPAEMRSMDAAVFFIRPTFSKLGSAPTKLGELLACGVPCLTNSGVGDIDRILRDGKAGIVVGDTGHSALLDGFKDLLKLVEDPRTTARCRAAAVRHFSLEEGVRVYNRIYLSLTGVPKNGSGTSLDPQITA
jgi:glycosyltransferase involved in cell wall biosynthesis